MSEVPQHTFMGEPCEQNNNVRVIRDESPIEVCKAKKRLNIFHLIVSILAGSIFKLSFERMKPRYSMELTEKQHLSGWEMGK